MYWCIGGNDVYRRTKKRIQDKADGIIIVEDSGRGSMECNETSLSLSEACSLAKRSARQ